MCKGICYESGYTPRLPKSSGVVDSTDSSSSSSLSPPLSSINDDEHKRSHHVNGGEDTISSTATLTGTCEYTTSSPSIVITTTNSSYDHIDFEIKEIRKRIIESGSILDNQAEITFVYWHDAPYSKLMFHSLPIDMALKWSKLAEELSPIFKDEEVQHQLDCIKGFIAKRVTPNMIPTKEQELNCLHKWKGLKFLNDLTHFAGNGDDNNDLDNLQEKTFIENLLKTRTNIVPPPSSSLPPLTPNNNNNNNGDNNNSASPLRLSSMDLGNQSRELLQRMWEYIKLGCTWYALNSLTFALINNPDVTSVIFLLFIMISVVTAYSISRISPYQRAEWIEFLFYPLQQSNASGSISTPSLPRQSQHQQQQLQSYHCNQLGKQHPTKTLPRQQKTEMTTKLYS